MLKTAIPSSRESLTPPLKPLKIAHVIAGAATGGAELFYERLCLAQASNGLSVLPILRRHTERTQRLRAGGLTPLELTFGGLADFSTRRHIRQALRAFAPRIAVAWMNRAAHFMPRPQQGDTWITAGRLGGFYDLSYYQHCSHLIGNTRGITQWICQQGWATERVHYLPNFVADFAQIPPTPPPYLPKGAPFLLALGRLHHNKGFDILIRAMRSIPALFLVIVGDGQERSALENLIRRENLTDRVYLPGWITNPEGLIRACSVLVCPSRHEPLGNVILEGFSAERPVVATAAQGPTELISPFQNGLISPLEDDQHLAHTLTEVLENPVLAQQIAQGGRRTYEKFYTLKHVLNAWYQFATTLEA